MPRAPQLSQREQGKIDALHEKGLSNRQIAKKLKRSSTAIDNYVRAPHLYGIKKRTGRKPILSDREKRHIVKTASNRQVSSSQIVDELCLKVSRWTVNRALNGSGVLKYQKKQSSPALKKAHKEARLDFAKQHMTWKSEWENVVWSDEKKFNLDGPDGFNYYWHDLRKDKVFSTRRAMGGGSVMVWSSFGIQGVSEINFIEGRLNAEGYVKIIKANLALMRELTPKELIFQQDNASIHTAKLTMKWFKDNKVNVLDWPALSPDLNPIENLWGYLVRAVYADSKVYSNKEELKKAIQLEWSKIEPDTLKALVDSMPDRIFQVINLNGAKTKY